MDIEYKVRLEEEEGFVTLQGDLDDEVAGEALRKAFNRVFDSGRRTIVLDLEQVDIINSYGIGKLLVCHKRLQSEGGQLLVMPLKGNVKDVLELLMIDTILKVYQVGPESDDIAMEEVEE